VESWIPLAVDGGTCSYANDRLWVSEHYEPKDYPLRGEHTVTAGDGTVRHAWMVGYRVDGECVVPQCVFAVPDRVQGVAVLNDGRVVLSCSYGRTNPSEILICKDPTEQVPLCWVTMDGQSIPLWCLDEKAVLQRVAAPPMSEGCCVVDDSVYILFESGAYYYREFTPGNTAVDPTDKIWRFSPP
jgi:hypothetical protein